MRLRHRLDEAKQVFNPIRAKNSSRIQGRLFKFNDCFWFLQFWINVRICFTILFIISVYWDFHLNFRINKRFGISLIKTFLIYFTSISFPLRLFGSQIFLPFPFILLLHEHTMIILIFWIFSESLRPSFYSYS